MNAIVKSVNVGDSFSTQYGDLFPCNITLTDGRKGYASSKSNPPWYGAEGTEIIITENGMTAGQTPVPKWKVGKPEHAGASTAKPMTGKSQQPQDNGFVNHELDGLKLAKDFVVACNVGVTAEELADQAMTIARGKIIPFLRSVSQRHDETAKIQDAKKVTAEAIRQIIRENDLIPLVQANALTNSMLAAEYESAGSDATSFVKNLREKFAAETAPPPVADGDDDMPF